MGLYCLCRKPYDGTDMIQCPKPECGEWFHPRCLGTTMKALLKLDILDFECPLCGPGESGETTPSVPSNKPIPKKKKKIKKSKEKRSNTAKTKKATRRQSESTKN